MIEITSTKHFYNVLMENEFIIADFYANWCGPCKMMAEYLKRVQEKNEGIVVAKINIDKLTEMTDIYDINSLPTLFFIHRGKIIHKVFGMDESEVNNGIKMFEGRM